MAHDVPTGVGRGADGGGGNGGGSGGGGGGANANSAGKDWDWTSSYGRWSSWQQQLETAESVEQARLKNKRRRDKQNGDLRNVSTCNSDHSEELRIYEMPTTEQLEECDKFKAEGMLFYREGQYYRVRGSPASHPPTIHPCIHPSIHPRTHKKQA